MDAPKTCRAGGGPSAISAVNRQFLPRSWRTGVWEIRRGKEGIWRDRKRRYVRSQPTGHFNRKRRKKDWGIAPTMLPETQHLYAVVQGNAPSHRNGPKMAPGPSLYRKRRRRRGKQRKGNLHFNCCAGVPKSYHSPDSNNYWKPQRCRRGPPGRRQQNKG